MKPRRLLLALLLSIAGRTAGSVVRERRDRMRPPVKIVAPGPVRVGITLILVFVALLACSDGVVDPVGTRPGTPEGARAETQSRSTIRVRWLPVQNAASYRVYRRANLVGTFELFDSLSISEAQGQDTVAFLDTGLDPATFYGYQVRAVSELGSMSDASETVGARTAPEPGIEVRNSMVVDAGIPGDLDGFTLVASRAEFSTSVALAPNGRVTIAPLGAGEYELLFDDLAPGCEVLGGNPRTVDVTDQGTQTRANVEVVVRCVDPTRGAVEVEVSTVGNLIPDEPFGVRVSGEVEGEAFVDTLAVTPSPPPGAVARFPGLSVGAYDVTLGGLDDACSIDGSTDQVAEVEALEVTTVRYTVVCRVAPEGQIPLVGEWVDEVGQALGSAATGSTVVLRMIADVPDSVDLGTMQGVLSWNPALLRIESADDYEAGAGDEFTTLVTNIDSPARPAASLNLSAFTVASDPVRGTQGIGAFVFTVLSEGRAFPSFAVDKASDGENVPVTLAVDLPDLRLEAGTGSQPPVARPGGPYQVAVDQSIELDASASSDPDGGTIVSYVWDFDDGTVDTTQVSTVSHAWSEAGSYTVQLTVQDDEGLTGSNVATVTVSGAGGPRLIGRWANQTGTAEISSAQPGDQVSLLLCSDAPLSAIQIRLTGFSDLANLAGGLDLNSARTPLGDCSAQSDVLGTFVGGPVADPWAFGSLSTASSAGVGAVGIAQIFFEVTTDGVLRPTFEIEQATVFPTDPVSLTLDVDLLVIGTGGGGGSDPPTADAGPVYSGTAGADIALDGMGSSAAPGRTLTRYLWDFGDGSPVDSTSGAQLTHAWFSTGSFDVVLTVRDDEGRTDVDSTTATITDPSSGPYALRGAWIPSPAAPSEIAVLQLSTDPRTSMIAGGGEVTFSTSELRYEGIEGVGAFQQTLATVEAPGRVSFIGVASTTQSGSEIPFVRLRFTVLAASGTTVGTSLGSPDVRGPGFQAIDVSTLPILDASLPINQENRPPRADAGGPYAGITGQSVALDGTGSTDPDANIASYSWDFGDGSTGSGATPAHTFASAGSFTVTLTVTDAEGETSSDTAPVEVVSTVLPVAEANGPYSGDLGQPVELSAAGSIDPDGSIVRFSWDFGDGATGTGPVPQHVYDSPGSYTAVLTVTDDVGATDSDSAAVTISPPSSYSLRSEWVLSVPSPSSPMGAPPVVDFGEGQAGPGDRVTLLVQTDPGLSFTDLDMTLLWDSAGLRYRGLVPGGAFDASFSATPTANTLTVEGAASAPVGAGSATTVVQIEFTVLALEGARLTPRFTGVAIANGGTPLVLDDLPVLQATLEVVEGSGGGPNEPPVADAGPDVAAAEQDAVTFSGSASDPDGMVVRYDWDFGDGRTAYNVGPTVEHVYDAPGVYDVVLRVLDDRGAQAVDTTTATIAALPNQRPTANAAGPYSGSVDSAVTFDGGASTDPDGSIVSYAWTFGDGNSGSGATAQHQYAAEGTYEVMLVVVDDDGAVDTTSTTATIEESPAEPNIFLVWTDGAGSEITSSSVGDTISLQICAGPDTSVHTLILDFDATQLDVGTPAVFNAFFQGVGACRNTAGFADDGFGSFIAGGAPPPPVVGSGFSTATALPSSVQGLVEVPFVILEAGSITPSLVLETLRDLQANLIEAVFTVPTLPVS